MASNDTPNACRLCRAPLLESEARRQLCGVCDDYAQYVALQTNRRLDTVIGELENGPMFVAASRNAH